VAWAPEQLLLEAQHEVLMLRIYQVILLVVRMLQPVIETIARRNRTLADQLDRASMSVALNVCEGDAHRGAMRRHKYEVALGEAREVVGCLALAEAKGLAVRPDGIDDHLNHVIGVLVKLTR
jgi:four helix bundle protein